MQKLVTTIFIFLLTIQVGLGQGRYEPPSAILQHQFALAGAADPGDENWFALSGMNFLNYALAVDASGDLYVGGQFTTAGGTNANYVAKWDGNNWSALGSGMSSFVHALAFGNSGNLYAGGIFTTSGGVTTNRIAKWDGNNWTALGSGIGGFLGGTVFALVCDGSGNLYAGGDFSMAGGNSANNIAKWDGNSWSALGGGMSSQVIALALDSSNNLYAGGSFTGGANFIAKWNGSNWSALGSGTSDWVYALTVDDSDNVYAGGFFNMAGGDSITGVAKWDGESWSDVDGGVSNGVRALEFDSKGNLYAGGLFSSAGGSTSATNIAMWDGNSWSPLGSGVDGEVLALAEDGNGNLFTAGNFNNAGGKSSDFIALWVDPTSVPVELASFSAGVLERFVKLEWITATETNNFGFEIERGADGFSFSKLGFVGGHGTTTTPQQYQFVDEDLTVGTRYYRLKQIDLDGTFEYSHVIETAAGAPKEFALAQNYPNPFNPSTEVSYDLPEQAKVRLEIFNMVGQKVRTLVDQEQTAGTKILQWNATDDFGQRVAGGTYILRLQATTGQSSKIMTKKMTLLK